MKGPILSLWRMTVILLEATPVVNSLRNTGVLPSLGRVNVKEENWGLPAPAPPPVLTGAYASVPLKK